MKTREQKSRTMKEIDAVVEVLEYRCPWCNVVMKMAQGARDHEATYHTEGIVHQLVT